MTPQSTPSRSRRPVQGALSLALLAMLLGLYACAPKITKVDTTYTMPEGVVTPGAKLLVWGDLPTTSYIFGDLAPADPDTLDTLITTVVNERYTPNTIHGMIIDNTDANAFQLFRRESGGGVRQFTNYDAPRTRQWLGSHYEAFHFIDPAPANFVPATYVARGKIDGVVNPQSPLTGLVSLRSTPIANISLRAVWYPPGKIKLRWDPVVGASGYLLNVYDFRGDLRSNEERYLSGTPAPFYDGQSTDLFIGYLPANMNFLIVGDSTGTAPTGVTTFAIRPMVAGSALKVRLTAFDNAGHVIAMTLGDPNPQTAFRNGEMGLVRGIKGITTYLLYPLSATTTRDTTIRTGGGGGGGGGL